MGVHVYLDSNVSLTNETQIIIYSCSLHETPEMQHKMVLNWGWPPKKGNIKLLHETQPLTGQIYQGQTSATQLQLARVLHQHQVLEIALTYMKEDSGLKSTITIKTGGRLHP